MRIFIYLLSSLALLAVSACSTPKPLQIISQDFSHRIDEHNNKTFIYKLQVQSDSRLLEAEGLRGNHKVGKGAFGDSVKLKRKADYRPQLLQRVKASLKAQAVASLEQRLRQNRFCREGYQLNNEFIGLQNLKLEGRCEELASREDHKDFPNPNAEPEQKTKPLGLTAE